MVGPLASGARAVARIAVVAEAMGSVGPVTVPARVPLRYPQRPSQRA
jgi:hypothetical protein